jgi:DNA-binding NtrC family response regulator
MCEPFRVLIVDDEEELLSTLVERLEFRGIDAVGVLNGTQALAEIGQREFDIVVLDVKLKGEDGVNLMKKIEKVRPNLPTILLTGHMSPGANKKGLQAGAADYVLKPTNLEDLIRKMKEAIANHRKGENQ